MRQTTYVGIDPGLTGAVAVIGPYGGLSVYDMPTEPAGVSGRVRHRVACRELAYRLSSIEGRVVAAIEKVASMPGQGVASVFSLGDSFGAARGCCEALGILVIFVSPVVWKNHFGLIGKDKNASRKAASVVFPEHASLWAAKTKHGRAEAALLAAYLRAVDT